MLVVEGQLAGAAALGGRSLVATALDPGEGGYLAVDRVGDLELGTRPLDGYRAVVLDGVGGLGDAAADQLARFVRGGGALVNFLGESTSLDNANGPLATRGLVPGRLVGRIRPESSVAFAFDPRNAHPYLEAFAGVDRSGLDAPVVRQFWQITPDAGVDRVLAFGTADEDPAILLHTLGGGRIVTVATSASDAEWTLLPMVDNYAAFLHELVRSALTDSAAGGTAWQTIDVGDVLRVPPAADLPPGVVPRLRVGEATPTLPLRPGDVAGSWEVDAPEEPGEYELIAGETRLPIAVNFPATESDLRRATPDAIRAALGGIELSSFDLSPRTAAAAESDDRPDWGWPLLAIVLLLVGAETGYAAYLGRLRR